jgi:hypothetical protein
VAGDIILGVYRTGFYRDRTWLYGGDKAESVGIPEKANERPDVEIS